jgi:hypothetical protein
MIAKVGGFALAKRGSRKLVRVSAILMAERHRKPAKDFEGERMKEGMAVKD